MNAEKTTNDNKINNKPTVDIEKLLFQKFDKPKNYLKTKIFNVYDNRYRINVYYEKNEENLTKMRMHASYFVKLEDNKLEDITLKA